MNIYSHFRVFGGLLYKEHRAWVFLSAFNITDEGVFKTLEHTFLV